MNAYDEVPTGDPARVFTGIRDVPIYAGESSQGNRLPGGPYRGAELVAIGLIMLPTLCWFKAHPDGGFAVLIGGLLATVAVTVILRTVLPKRRPSLTARVSFALTSLVPKHVCADQPKTRNVHDA